MVWVRLGQYGLQIVDGVHFNEARTRELIAKLRLVTSRNPTWLCNALEAVLETRMIPDSLTPRRDHVVWRLSKWCDWNDESMHVARDLAKELFNGHVCRRLLNQLNQPIPDKNTADADYDQWIVAVAAVTAHDFRNPDEVDPNQTFTEGAVRKVFVNAYERNPEARKKCIDHYGARCAICQFSFAKAYPGVGDGYIHVHHIRMLTDIQAEYDVDPINDLIPLCPNCHAMIHLYREPFSVPDVEAMVKNGRSLHCEGPFA